MPKGGYHKDFVKPTAQQRVSALGPFPFIHKSNESRNEMLRRSADAKQQISLLLKSQQVVEEKFKYAHGGGQNCTLQEFENITAISDLDDEKLYKQTVRSETSRAIPKPADNLDWLAQVPEEGQTFEDYVSFLTTRTTGRIRPIANAEGVQILLLPIVIAKECPSSCSKSSGMRNDAINNEHESNDNDGDGGGGSCDTHWPEYGPPLAPLLEYTEVFFDRKVTILPAAKYMLTIMIQVGVGVVTIEVKRNKRLAMMKRR